MPGLQNSVSSAGKSGTVMQGVDTIVAMPQWYINFNLENLLENGRTADGKSLRQVDLTFGTGVSWLHGTVSGLWTNVFVQGAPSKVKFILAFESGTMDFSDITVVPAQQTSCDISGLQFGFDVDLSSADVGKDTTLPEEVRKRAEALLGYLGPGAFSIQQLFMDLEHAPLDQFDVSLTHFPSTMPSAAQAAFRTYLATYLAALRQAGGNVLGYAITVSDTADLKATYPPTSLEFATSQYQGEGTPPALNADLDTVNYLLMTGGRSFPANPRPWWGNFVVPSDSHDGSFGTIAMANQLFVKTFLLQRLAPEVLTYWMLGDADGDLAPRHAEATGMFSPTMLGGFWASGTMAGRSHRTNTWSNDDVDYEIAVSVELTVSPGGNTIVIKRNTDFNLHYTHWYGVEGHAVTSEYRVWYSVPLTVTVKLLGVLDGQLQVSATSTTTQPGDVLYSEPYGWDITRTEGSYPPWDSVGGTLESAISDTVAMAMPKALLPGVEAAITRDLNLSPFVFPGGAQLFMANPVFNDEGDLLLGLQYKF